MCICDMVDLTEDQKKIAVAIIYASMHPVEEIVMQQTHLSLVDDKRIDTCVTLSLKYDTLPQVSRINLSEFRQARSMK